MQIEHIAVGVVDLEASIAYYREYFGYKWDGKIYVDPQQMARIAFIETIDSNIKIELVQPTCIESPVTGPLRRGSRILHICYQVKDIELEINRLAQLGSRIISEPQSAVAFSGRRVAFVFTRDREVVELVESNTKEIQRQ